MVQKKPLTRLVRPLRGGQITIPITFRKQLGITDETLLQVTLIDDELHIRPVRVSDATHGSPWLKELYERFAPVRQEIEERGIPEQEVDADIDAAIAAARAERRVRRT